VNSEQSRIAEIPSEQQSPAQASLVRRLIGDRGRVPTPFKVWLHSPALADRLQGLGGLLATGTSLSKREAKIAILLMAAHWRAEYVFKMHAREAREAGLPETVIEAIAVDRGSTSCPQIVDSREQMVYQLVGSFVQIESVPDAMFADAVRQLGHAGVAELLALCGYFTSVALAMKLYRVS
jgi:4-carboxymuconolactone decarboxylase